MKTIAAVLLVVLLARIPFSGQNLNSGRDNTPHHEVKQNTAIPLFAIIAFGTGKSISIDPMLFFDNGHIRSVPDPCTDSPALHNFESQYLSSGKTYSLIFGGSPHGTVTVLPLSKNSDWHVKLASDVRIEGVTMALATDPHFVPTRVGLRRRPTPDEQRHAETLAKEILTKQGAPVAALSRLHLTQIIATDLGGRLQLVVSAEIESLDDTGMEYSLFFIADPHSEEADIIWFQQPKSETDAEAVYFLDHLGESKDGDRIFVRRVFYENYRYEVYRSEGGHWKNEFQSEIFGCL